MSEEDLVGGVVTELTERLNKAEAENAELKKRIAPLEAEVHALRARITAVALVLRP